MQIETEIKLNTVLCGKSEEQLKKLPDNFFDGIVTDPPYEIGIMGKAWDASGIAYNVELWKEVLRVAKPGSFLFCFGGTRTYHRVACAIEDAGWQIKDSMSWLYGSGFPKSTNISKQIDKEAGAKGEKIGDKKLWGHNAGSGAGSFSKNQYEGQTGITRTEPILAPATPDAKQWDGYGTALKPAHEPIIVAMKPLEKGLTYAANAQKWNVAGLNIDGARIGIQFGDTKQKTAGRRTVKWGVSEGGCTYKKGTGAEFTAQGRWPANVILSHSPDCVCVGTKQINEGAPEGGYTYKDNEYKVEGFVKTCKPKAPSNRGQETVEVYACVPDCPIRIMDSQSGQLSQCGGEKNTTHKDGMFRIGTPGRIYREQFRGASRFFYCAKASRSEREKGLREFTECVKCGKFNSKTHTAVNPETGAKSKENCTRNNHPTVKPVDLMKYLLTLIKMPSAKKNKQVILDPFCGSGTTLVAAEQLGINYIGIDQDSDNVLISIGRIGT